MPNDSLFKTLPRADDATVLIYIDDLPHQVPRELNVAAALLATGRAACRTTPVSGAARAPFCMMGVCFDCLVEIDGLPNRQGCMTPVQDGMRIHRMAGARQLA
jgi:hypothetical protein